MIILIDQSAPPNADPNQPVACTYRCDKCQAEFKALTLARAQEHKCGKPAAVVVDENAELRAQIAVLKASIEALQQPKPEKRKAGRPKKVVEPIAT